MIVDVSFWQKSSLRFSLAECALESLKPTPVNKKATPGNSLDMTSMKGIEPPHPMKIGSLPLKTSLVESKTIFLSSGENSGAQKPSATSTTSIEILAPNDSSRWSSMSTSRKRLTTCSPD